MIQASSTFLTANAVLQKKPIFRLDIATYGRSFVFIPTNSDGSLVEAKAAGEYNWIEDISDLSISVSDLDGGADLGTLSVTVQDRLHKITADLPGSQLEGKAVTLKTGFPGMARADYVTLFTGIVDTIIGANDNNSYVFNCVDSSQVLSKVIYPLGDSGFPTDSDNPRTLNGHPLDILVSALTTEVGLDLTQINLGKIYGYRDGIYAGMQFTFSLDSPPSCKDFLENEILKPLGGYLFVNSRGQFDINFFYPTSIIPVYLGGLIGAFVDGTGQLVAAPFLIANGLSKKVPAGAVALQMGTNDSFYTDNSGGLDVTINGGSLVHVTANQAPWTNAGGINSAYPLTVTGATAPASRAVTAGTTITIAVINYDGTVLQGISVAPGSPYNDGIGVAGTLSPAGAPGLFATPAVVFKVPVMALTIDNTLEIPLAQQADLTNVVLFKFDKDSGGTFFAQSLNKYSKSITRFGSVGAGQLYGEQIIESAGMRSGLQGFFLAQFVSRLIFLRYGLKNLMYEGVPHLWTTCVLEPGDIVSVTNKYVPDRAAGTFGITNKLMEVMDRDWNFLEGTVTLKLLDASYLAGFGGSLITPDAEPVFTSASADDKKAYLFLANNSDQYSDGTAANLMG